MPRLLLTRRCRGPVVSLVAAAAVTWLLASSAAAVPAEDVATPTPSVSVPSTEEPSAAPTTDLTIEPFPTATGDPDAVEAPAVDARSVVPSTAVPQPRVAGVNQHDASVGRGRAASSRPAALPRTGGTVRTGAVALLLLGVGALLIVVSDRGRVRLRSRHRRRH